MTLATIYLIVPEEDGASHGSALGRLVVA
jgi:hypothetical protein